MLEPSDEQVRCMMLRQNLAELELNGSQMGYMQNTAQEMEPSSMKMNPLNLSLDEHDPLPRAGQPDPEIGQEFEQNTSNVSFG